MKLYITGQKLKPLCGVVIHPQFLGLKVTHLTLASQTWDALFIDIDEDIPEGSLRFLPSKCKSIRVSCPERPSLHQLHLLVELYPELDGKLRKAFLKGKGIGGILPEMWEYGEEVGRESV